jgi:hypothetical protein
MRKKILAITILSIIFFSCNKNKTDNNNVNGSESSLKSMVTIFNGEEKDSAVFLYDSKKRIIGEQVWADGGLLNGENISIARTNSGIITAFADGTLNSSHKVSYNSSSQQYTSIRRFNDSTIFSYTNDRISEAKYYSVDFSYPQRNLFTYDVSGNIIKIENFELRQGNWESNFVSSYKYDNKVNPIQMGNEAIVLEESEFLSENGFDVLAHAGPNNVVYSTNHYTGANESTFKYEYNVNDLPTSLILLFDPGTINQYKNKISFFY